MEAYNGLNSETEGKETVREQSNFTERSSTFKTASGPELGQRINRGNEVNTLSEPGFYPYTRGIYPTMYRNRLWTMRQYAGFGSSKETNERFRYLLNQGQTGLSLAFDLPTQLGYDSDHNSSAGEIGKVGVPVDTLADMEILLKEIQLDEVSLSMTINAPAAILLAMFIAVAEKQEIPLNKLKGTIQNDILKEYIARGTYIFPPKPSLRLMTNIIEYCTLHTPKLHTLSISGYHIREAGSNAVQELAFTIANGIRYIDAAISAGLHVDDFAPRITFFFSAHNNIFEEIAKFRAARRIWAKIMKEQYQATNPDSWKLRFHTQTAGSTLTAQQLDNNIVRVTLQALGAILGGTQSLHTNSRDEALSLPTEESVRIALRTQQIIAYESGVADLVDPLAGSFHVETLTNQVEKETIQYIEKITQMGGAIAAVENGFMVNEIQKSAYACQEKIEDGRDTVVGVNKFVQEEKEDSNNLIKVDKVLEEEQIQSLREIRNKRNHKVVKEKLEILKEKAKNPNENLIPTILDAVKAYASIGEICDILRKEFGEYKRT